MAVGYTAQYYERPPFWKHLCERSRPTLNGKNYCFEHQPWKPTVSLNFPNNGVIPDSYQMQDKTHFFTIAVCRRFRTLPLPSACCPLFIPVNFGCRDSVLCISCTYIWEHPSFRAWSGKLFIALIQQFEADRAFLFNGCSIGQTWGATSQPPHTESVLNFRGDVHAV